MRRRTIAGAGAHHVCDNPQLRPRGESNDALDVWQRERFGAANVNRLDPIGPPFRDRDGKLGARPDDPHRRSVDLHVEIALSPEQRGQRLLEALGVVPGRLILVALLQCGEQIRVRDCGIAAEDNGSLLDLSAGLDRHLERQPVRCAFDRRHAHLRAHVPVVNEMSPSEPGEIVSQELVGQRVAPERIQLLEDVLRERVALDRQHCPASASDIVLDGYSGVGCGMQRADLRLQIPEPVVVREQPGRVVLQLPDIEGVAGLQAYLLPEWFLRRSVTPWKVTSVTLGLAADLLRGRRRALDPAAERSLLPHLDCAASTFA